MNLYTTIGLLVAVAIAQTAVAPAFVFLGARPDFMLVVVVVWSVLRGAEEGVVWGGIGGMALDLLSGSPFGIFTISLVLIAFLTSMGETHVSRANVLLPGATIILATGVHNLLILALVQVTGRPVTWDLALASRIAPAAGLNLICLTILYPPLRWLQRRISGAELPIGR